MLLAWIFVSLLAALILFFQMYRIMGKARRTAKARELTSGGGISAVESVMIGSIRQTIMIQGADIRKPVLLVVHGGPSMPFPGVSCRAEDYVVNLTTDELVKHYVVVFWDQRGTGRSFDPAMPASELNLERFIQDTLEMTDYLRNHFGREKITLAAVSWGTYMSLSAVARRPEAFSAYLGLAQLVNWTESDRESYDWVVSRARELGNRKALKELEAIGRPPYGRHSDRWGLLRKWIVKFGGMMYVSGTIKPPGFGNALRMMLTSPDYTLRDLFNTVIRGMKLAYQPGLTEEFGQIDLMRAIQQLDVPVHLFHGRHDRNLSGGLAHEFFAKLDAPQGKSFQWLPNSAHMFHPSDARTIEAFLVNLAVNGEVV